MSQNNQVGTSPLESKKHSDKRKQSRNWAVVAAVLVVAFSLSVSALQNPGQSNAPQTGGRNAGVKPKRVPERREKRKSSKTSVSSARREAGQATMDSLSPVLAAADFDLMGLAVTAGPPSLTVPKNTPTSIQTSVRVPEGTDPAALIAALNPNYRVRGELTGPSLTAPLTLEAPIGQALNIPPLSNAGDHLVRNLRVVDTSTPDQSVVTSVTPDSCGIVVIERLLISQVEVHELTYDQIIQAGINITDDSYKAFNFTLGIATSSTAQTINIPVAFPSVGVADPRPLVGIPSVSGPGIDVPTVMPIMLTAETIDGQPSGLPPGSGEAPVRIPGVIVFPGRVGLLHQFFEAIVIVGNGAPNGTPLILHSLRAKANLPDNGTPADSSDDPLRIAETQTGGRVSELELHGLGPDGKYGTGDDTVSFSPGQSGQASFLLEGLKEGLHTINFDLEAVLEGLPGGPIKVRGEVPGAVLVRDASFAVTFTHPGVVRAGNEYDLGMTIYNSGQTDIQGAFAQLSRNSISGAELIGQDAGQRQFATTIKRGESATVKWRLRSNTTGEVTASYVKVGDGISAGLTLVTGVGDRNIPLSPDSLILPDPVNHLPANVVEAGRALLGQAWSIANAPSGSLPPGVTTVTKQTVVDRAVELGIAGMRVDFGEPVSVSLDTLLRDWLGALQDVPDPGFADTQRNTRSGYEWFDSLGDQFYQRLNAGTAPIDLHQEFANTELPRSRFISALVTQASGQPVMGARFVDAQGGRVGFGASADERDGALTQGGSVRLAHADVISGASTSVGEMLVVSNPNADNWTLELNGWRTGTVDISLLAPATSPAYSQFVWTGVPITGGGMYRVRFKPLSVATAPVLEEFRDGAWQATTATAAVTTLNQPAPRVVGIIQVTPEVVAGGDKYGRLVGVLFSKPMLAEQAQTISRYKIGGGALRGSSPVQQVGGLIGVTGARIDYGNRFVFLSLNSTIGPYIDRDLTITSLQDTHHLPLSPSPSVKAIMPRVSPEGVPPGAYLTGRVLNADGTPIKNAPVITWAQECPNPLLLLPPEPKPIALKYTDAQGRYEIDYVRDSDCAPLNVSVNNPTTNSEKRLTSAVAYDGQHMVLDMVFLARGNVEGDITSAGQPMPKAFVRVVPDLDVIGTKVVQADLNGHYVARDVPVGNVSVLAVGDGVAHNASGFSAGTINGQGQTAFINVALQNISGVVRGHVFRQDLTPSAGALVVVYAVIPGFHSLRQDGATAVGYAFADRDGSFTIANLPVSSLNVEVTDYVTGLIARQDVQLTTAAPEVNGIVITLLGTGSVSGRVTDDIGTPLANVFVSSAGGAVQTDSLGNYTLPGLQGGIRNITAFEAVTQRSGSTQAPVTVGQTTLGIDIVILRLSALQGTVSVIKEGTATPLPATGVSVSADGFTIVNTDAEGHYTIANVPPGDLILRFVDPGKGYAVNTPVKLAPGETLSRDATFRPGSVHGKVFQPDGVTSTIAQLTIYVQHPEPTPGYGWGLISTEPPFSMQTAADGSYSLTGLNPGKYRLSTSNVFFPTPVTNGGTLAPGGNDETNLILVSTLAGKIQGHVFQSDGTTLVGPGIRVTLSGGSLADATVRTDETGHYEFGEVFSAGSYQLAATDPVSGNTNRMGVAVQRNQDAVFDLRLLGSGNLRVQVLDGAGQPVQSGSITLDGTDYPNAHRFAEITPGSNGQVTFSNLPEGPYAISATRFGLGGRVSARVPNSSTVDVSVQLQATGNIVGHVYLPDGVTPISLADVQLRVGGRSVGFTVTAEDPDTGNFIFVNVPTGDFTLDAFDNHTGRVGRAAGSITAQGQTAVVNVLLLPVGAVSGRVTANGISVDHAAVSISADGSGVRGANLFATTDPDGHYRFTGIPAGRFVISVSDAPGGQTGSASGAITGTVEPLPDTIIDIALAPSQTVTGAVFQLGGVVPVSGAQVTINAGGRVFQTATNDQGTYSLAFVALGEVRVRAEAPVGYDRGQATPVFGTQPGGSVTINVTLDGVGIVSGDALESNGALLSAGTVTFTNDVWGTPVVLYASVQANGHYEVPAVPAGHFSLRLVVPNRVGVGSAGGEVLAGQTTNLPLRLEDAGTVTGAVKSADGTTPVQGASVNVTLMRPAGSLSFYAHTNAEGVWTLGNVPLGTLDIFVSDEVSGSIARAHNAVLATNGQTVDLGVMLLDRTPISVVSVDPANGATSLPTNGTVVRITFSEPAESSTVNSGTVQLQQGIYGIGATISLSSDGRVATLTPLSRLNEGSTYVVFVSQVEDRNGLRLATPFTASFVTADETAPMVTTIAPANGATEIPIDSNVVLTFSEPIDRSANLADIVKVAANSAPETALTGSYETDTEGRVVSFRPAGGLSESAPYTIKVNGERDLSGNIQTQAFISTFTTQDRTAPVIDPLPIDGATVHPLRPTVTATYHDNLSGIKTSAVVLTVDNINVTQSASVTATEVSYTPAVSLALGAHNVTLAVADNAGNVSVLRTATFSIVDETAPTVTTIAPANGGTEVLPEASIVVSFDEPIDRTASLAAVIKVAASQSPTPLAGSYELDAGGSVATFRPAGGFGDSTQYTITVSGQRDASGNIQTQAVVSSFTTQDRTAPVIDPLPIDGTSVRLFRPTITATYHDNLSGIKTSSVVLTLDSVSVTQNAIVTGSQVSYTPAVSLAAGHHTVTVAVADNIGNVSTPRNAAFDIDDSGPAISSFTIGGASAVNGMYVTSSLQPVFAITYADNTGINLSSTQLLFAPQGSPLVQVPATVTATGLTYQPPAYLAEGPYAVQAIITNNLGTSSTTGVINFTLDVDAPDILSVTPATGSQHGGTTVTLTGARLLSTTGAAPIVSIGGNAALVTSAVAGSPDQVTIITPAGAPGAATLRMNTDRGTGVLVGGYTYQADPRTPFITEVDTTLLWHMDEQGDGPVRLTDSGITRSIFGTASGASLAQPGRFAFGRSNANIVSDANNLLSFGSSNFTIECWVKTDVVGRTYTIVGKEDFYGYYYGPPEYAVRLMPTGNLRALLYDTSQRQWFTELDASTYRVDDNQWHYVAMVVNRASSRLSLYVDGFERTFSAPPENFGDGWSQGQPLRVGHWAYFEPETTGGPEAFPGTIDEIRVSSTAHTAEVIQNTYLGTEGTLGITITNSGPLNIGRGTTVEVPLTGYNLAGVTARVTGSASGQLTANVLSSAATQARVEIVVPAAASLGDAQLVLSSSQGSATLALHVIDLSLITLAVESDTKLLWHLNETGNGSVTVLDEGPIRINGTSGGLSLAQPGRFAGGRAGGDLATNPSVSDLTFGSSNFTVEGWVKTDVVGRTYTLFGKEDFYGYYFGPPEYAVRLFPNGTLRSLAYDSSQRAWFTDLPATLYRVDDNQWHYVVMVVDRTNSKMSLYVDGLERASSAPPQDFGPIWNQGQPFRAGHWAYFEPQTTGGPQEFPGVLDEIRVSSTAHTAGRILDDMNGSSPMRVISYDPKEVLRQRAGLPSYINQITANGYNLEGATARLQVDGQTAAAVVNVLSSSYRQAVISVDVAATVPLGNGQLVISKPGQTDVAIAVRIGDRAESTGFNDTILLWNLNEADNGPVRILDSGALGINGTAGSLSLAQPGHFGGGRSNALIVADADNEALKFGTSSFTLECWFKTGVVGRTYTLIGKEDGYGFYFGPPEYSIKVLPSGGMRAMLFDSSQRQWKVEMPQSIYQVDDNQWHHAAMVVDRTSNKLSLYVDGVERASAEAPSGFGALWSSSNPLRVGKWSYFDEQTSGGPEEFPGVLDDIRISASAHTQAQIVDNMNGLPGLRVNSYTPEEALRNKTTGETFSTLVSLTGFGLDGVSASLRRGGQPLDATANVESSAFNQAQVRLSINSSVATGTAQLVLTKPGLPDVSLEVRVTEQSEFATDPDTRLLWHLNETDNGAVRLVDAGPLGLGGTASSLSLAEPGHFDGGRSRPAIIADNDYGALYFGSSSFTAECWFKTAAFGRTYTLIGKEDPFGFYFGPPEYSLKLLPSGGMRAIAYDTSQRQWKAEFSGHMYDPTTGRWQTMMDDNQWHHAAMVVDRTNNKMSIYVDGVERASSASPVGFAALWSSSNPLRVGKWSYFDEQTTGGPEEFPGVIDEVRLSASAHTPERVLAGALGTDTAHLSLTQPAIVQRGSTNVPLTFTGYGLTNASVTTDQPNVSVAIVSSGSIQVNCLISVPANVPVGTIHFAVTSANGQVFNPSLTIVDQQPFTNNPSSSAETLLLWHLDEASAGAVRVDGSGDDVPTVIGGNASSASLAQTGRFGGGRTNGNILADNSAALYPGSSSFTVECWVKAGTIGRTYTLVGKEDSFGYYFGPPEYSLKLLPSGGVRALAYDTGARQWKAEMPGRLYDAASGNWQTNLNDGQWHYLVMVVDRGYNRMSLYADGVERATSASPAGFGALWNGNNQLRVGKWSYFDEQTTGGPEEFPGTLDEVRVLNFARSAAQIADTWFGTDTASTTPLTLIDPIADWSHTSAHSPNFTIEASGYASYFNGDDNRASRVDGEAGTVEWHYPNLSGFEMITYDNTGYPHQDPIFETSADGLAWNTITPTITTDGGSDGAWPRHYYRQSGLSDVNYVRASFAATGPDLGWTVKLTQMTLTAPPGSNSLTAKHETLAVARATAQPIVIVVPTSQSQLRTTSVTPTFVTRNRSGESAQVSTLTIEGADLSGIAAQVMRDGQPLNSVAASVQDSSDRQAHLAVAVLPTTPLGVAQLVLSKPGYSDVSIDIQVAEPSRFALEADTIGLWHLDELDEGATHLLDAGERAINLSTAQASRVVEGRFGGGRALARATADTSNEALLLGASSFTVEGWVKTEALERDYVLVGKETNSGQNTDFTLKALASGALRAELYDTSGLVWQAETPDRLTDGQWHAVALVVDREAGLLSLYIDGQMRVAAPAPVGFAAMRNLGQPLEFGCFDADGPVSAAPEEFPGILDEVRISAAAHSAEKIASDFFGHDEPQFTLASPAVVRKGTGPVLVTISGYGLAGAGVTTKQAGVTISVISSNFTSLTLSLALSDSVAPGPVQLTITDTLGRTITVEVNAVDRGAGSRNVSPAKDKSGASQARAGLRRQGPTASRPRPPDPAVSPSRTRSQTGASIRSARLADDAKSVGGQR